MKLIPLDPRAMQRESVAGWIAFAWAKRDEEQAARDRLHRYRYAIPYPQARSPLPKARLYAVRILRQGGKT